MVVDEPEDSEYPLEQKARSKQIMMMRDCIADLVVIVKDQQQRISTLENKVRTLERIKP